MGGCATGLEQCVPGDGPGLGSDEAAQDNRGRRFANSGTLPLGSTDKQSLSVAPLLTLVQPIESALKDR